MKEAYEVNTMKLALLTSGTALYLRLPHEGADHAIATGDCPKCGSTNFGVQGKNQRISDDDQAYEADGYCCACKAHVGTIRAELNTLFGLREDEVVLHGRPRVY